MRKPELFHRKFKNGTESKEWYFRISINKIRKLVNTKETNKQKALLYMNKWLAGENANKSLNQSSINKIQAKETLPELLSRTGWLNAKTNPKYTKAIADKSNYGIVQAKKIADALNHMFIDIGDVDAFSTYLRLNDIIKINRVEDYTDFISKPYQELTVMDASRFKNFIVEYCDWLKRNNKKRFKPVDRSKTRREWEERKKRKSENLLTNSSKERPENKYFMCQSRINIIALKAFYTHSFENQLVKDNIFKNEKIPTSKQTVNKEIFTIQQIQTLFDKKFAKFISDKEFKGFSTSSLFRAYEFCAYTGMRSGEVRALQWKQISADNKILEINNAFKIDSTKKDSMDKPKWNKVRTIVLCDGARECLGERGFPNQFVFALPNGNPIGSSKFINIFNRYIGWVELEVRTETSRQGNELSFTNGKHYTPHSFRGTLNSLLLSRALLNESAIQEYLGWTKSKLTRVQEKYYTKFDEVAMWKVANEIEKIFFDRPLSWEIEKKQTSTDFSNIVSSIIERNDVDNVGFNEELNKRVSTMGTYDNADKYYSKE